MELIPPCHLGVPLSRQGLQRLVIDVAHPYSVGELPVDEQLMLDRYKLVALDVHTLRLGFSCIGRSQCRHATPGLAQ